MKILISLILLLLLFTACTPKYTWNHPHLYSIYDFNRDAAECDMYAQQVYYGIASPHNIWATLAGAEAAKRAMENCMHSKGYYKVLAEEE